MPKDGATSRIALLGPQVQRVAIELQEQRRPVKAHETGDAGRSEDRELNADLARRVAAATLEGACPNLSSRVGVPNLSQRVETPGCRLELILCRDSRLRCSR